MSIESTYKNRLDLNLLHNKPLQSTLSQQESDSRTRSTLLNSAKDRQRQDRSKSRNRTQSNSLDTPPDTVTDSTSKPTLLNKPESKNDRRFSELKISMDHNDPNGERRYSTPQLHLSALFPNAFRNQKHHHHHHKTNTK
jgi:hypothetical protein